MRILFVFEHTGLVRHLGRVIELAALAGHDVVVSVCSEKKNLDVQTLEQLGVYQNVSQVKAIRVKSWWKPLLIFTRTLLDIGPYLRPGHPSPSLIERYQKLLPLRILHLFRHSWCASFITSGWLVYALRAIERMISPSAAICRYLQKIAPDVVVTTPYLFPSSADSDYLKAANSLKIPTCSAIVSWDNLSTKGTGHIPVDRLFVWNQELKEEANFLHGIDPEAITITGSPTFDHHFSWAPKLTRDEYCNNADISPEKTILLYLCSSGSIARDESRVVRRLAEAMKSNASTCNCILMVRPHPLNYKIWAGTEPLPDNVRIYPERGDLPDNPESIDTYCHSIHFSQAMIGLNTSAFLEASVLDRPCIALPALPGCYDQEKFGHFRHLLNGEFIHTPTTLEVATDIIAEIIKNGDPKKKARKQFVHHFIRPQGIGREASAIMLDAILETARSPRQHQRNSRSFFSRKIIGLPRDNRRSVVYVLIGLSHFPYHESVISALCRAGFRVDLTILKLGTMTSLANDPDDTPIGQLICSFKEFIADHPNLHVLEIAKAELLLPEMSKYLRFLRSFSSYVRRVPESNFYRRRWLGYMPEGLARFANNFLVRALLKSSVTEAFLGWVDRALLCPPLAVTTRIRRLNPEMLFISPGDMRYNHEVEWLKAAKKLKIPTSIVTLSWDNLTTKGLIHLQPDYLFVWNASHADEARHIHHVPDESIFLVGSPFFDKWLNYEHLIQDRTEFMSSIGLDPSQSYIVYLGSSANIADNEAWLVRELYQAVTCADDALLRNTQIYVRPHPGNRKICADLTDLPVVLTAEDDAGIPFSEHRKLLLFNTLYHSVATVSINTSAIIDAIAINKPCISVKTERYGDTHTGSAHFRHLLDAGAVVMADDVVDCARLVGEHLRGADPSLNQRRKFVRSFIESPLPEMSAGETISMIVQDVLAGKPVGEIRRKFLLTNSESSGSAIK